MPARVTRRLASNRKPNGNQRGRRITQTLGRVSRPAPLALNPSNRRPLVESVTTLRGSDYLGPVTVIPGSSVSTASDRILKTLPVTPSGYIGTRITALANLWERYRIKRFHLRYVPAVPNTIACQLVLYLDTDPNDDPTGITDADALIRQAVAQTGAQQWNFNMTKTIPLARRVDDQWYYTGVDKQNERFNRQGTGYLIQITDPLNFNGEAITDEIVAGSLFLDWEVDVQIPQIEPTLVEQQLGATSSPGFSSLVVDLPISDADVFSKGTLVTNKPCKVLRRMLVEYTGQQITPDSTWSPSGVMGVGSLDPLFWDGPYDTKVGTGPTIVGEDPAFIVAQGFDEDYLSLDAGSHDVSLAPTPADGITYLQSTGSFYLSGPVGLTASFTPVLLEHDVQMPLLKRPVNRFSPPSGDDVW